LLLVEHVLQKGRSCCAVPWCGVLCRGVLCCALQAADKKSDNAQRDRLKNQFNLGVADCPVFPNIFDYCQVRAGRAFF
jgi:hypothetical protein